jgi:two-component system, cell cycle sensor histidine kinase and response regulator CckA
VDIFVVDDEPVIAETVAAILTHDGYRVSAFVDPLKALDALAEGCPRLLIADFIMGDMNGIELAARALKLCPRLRVIFMTASLNTHALHESGLAVSVLSKPIGVHPLLQTIREHFS